MLIIFALMIVSERRQPARWRLCQDRLPGAQYDSLLRWGLEAWIPAFSGMTKKRKQVGCHPDNPFAIPDIYLAPAPAVIPAQAGIQWF